MKNQNDQLHDRLAEAVEQMINKFNFGNSQGRVPVGFFKIQDGEVHVQVVFPSERAARKAGDYWSAYLRTFMQSAVLCTFTNSQKFTFNND
jgi:hypothetical protein